LLVFAFVINILGNRVIETTSFITAFVKIAGLLAFGIVILWSAGFSFEGVSATPAESGAGGFLGAVALGILAYKGFTTITNSGAEITAPHKNIGRAIIISLALCLVLYVLASLAVGAELTVAQIVGAKNYALAQAARPAFGDYGLWFTVAFAIVATISGVMASMFAVSRMLAMLTEMKLVPHSHFGMPGAIQQHTLVYTLVIATALTVFFDLSRIASLGAIFYIVLDIAVHWGLLRHLRTKVDVRLWIPGAAIALDLLVLGAFLIVKAGSDLLVLYVAAAGLLVVFVGEKLFVMSRRWA
jgi:amino acid transporter